MDLWVQAQAGFGAPSVIVAIFYPFSHFCEINISLLSLQKQPHTAPNLFQRGVEYGKYERASGQGQLLVRPVHAVSMWWDRIRVR